MSIKSWVRNLVGNVTNPIRKTAESAARTASNNSKTITSVNKKLGRRIKILEKLPKQISSLDTKVKNLEKLPNEIADAAHYASRALQVAAQSIEKINTLQDEFSKIKPGQIWVEIYNARFQI